MSKKSLTVVKTYANIIRLSPREAEESVNIENLTGKEREQFSGGKKQKMSS